MDEFNLSDFIKSQRLSLGLTTRELGELVGVSATTISKWEKNDIKHLKEDKIKPLAQALHVHPLRLFGYSNLSTLKEYNDTPIKKIPFYSVHNVDFFDDKNILKFISTDIDADFAVSARNYHEDVIKPHDVLLFARSFSNIHNKYLLIINENPDAPPYLDKCALIHGKVFLYNDGSYTLLPESDKVIGVLQEIRRLV